MALGLIAWAGLAGAQSVPYDLVKFRPVLDDSKLQAPTSSPASIPQGQFPGASNEYFFLDPTGQHMVFTVSGDGNRSELRQETPEWLTSTPQRRTLNGRLKVEIPDTPSLDQFTYMQIHDLTNAPGALNKPLIRLTWRRSRSGVADHLWAAIRIPDDPGQPISLDNLATEWIDIGPRPDGFFDASISVLNNRMLVFINGEAKIDKDVSYWDGLQNYFKAGVYLQDPGESAVMFDTLTYGLTAPADLSGDGDVDDEDLGLFFSAFTGPDQSQGPLINPTADLSNDNDVDDEDLGDAFGQFTGPQAPVNVPEPAGLTLLGLVFLAARRRRA